MERVEELSIETMERLDEFYGYLPVGTILMKMILGPTRCPLDFEIVYANREAERILGVARYSIFNRTFNKLPISKRDWFSCLSKTAIQGTVYEEDTKIDTSGKYAKVSFSQFMYGYVNVTLSDISALQNQVQDVTLKASELENGNFILTQEIIESLQNLYFGAYILNIKKDTYKELYSNDELRKYVSERGIISEAAQKLSYEYLGEDSCDKIKNICNYKSINILMRNKNVYDHYFQIENGKWIKIHFMAANRNEHGDIIEGILYFQDISKEKNRELDYKQKTDDAREEARQMGSFRSKFMLNMSHDIRTPINGIKGMLDIARSNSLDRNKIETCYSNIGKAADQLLTIIDDMFEMAKIESMDHVFENTKFDIQEFIRSCCQEAENSVREHNLEWIVDIGNIEYPSLLGNSGYLNQIIQNLVSNAIKFNKTNGKVKLEIWEEMEKTRLFVCINVSDTGIGMSETFQKYMFDPFTQEKSGARTSFEGIGIGLSIVKSLTDQMRGYIEVDSKPDEGTIVKLKIPFEISEDLEDREEDIPIEINNETLKGMKVLIAEDNSINAEILEFIMEDVGAVTTVAENGKICFDCFNSSKEGEYDVILMDLMMPEMDGYESALQIRALDRDDAKKIPIFAVSANVFPEDIKKCLDVGMNGHFAKPIDGEKLIKYLATYKG